MNLDRTRVIFIGIIGEYVGRIFNEVKDRPLYIIEEIDENKMPLDN